MIEIIVLNDSHRFNFLISASFRFVVHFSIRFVNLRKFKKWNFRRWYYCCARTSFVRISRQRLFHGSTESGCRQQKHLPKKRTKTINNDGWERHTRLLLLFLAAIRFIFFFSFFSVQTFSCYTYNIFEVFRCTFLMYTHFDGSRVYIPS